MAHSVWHSSLIEHELLQATIVLCVSDKISTLIHECMILFTLHVFLSMHVYITQYIYYQYRCRPFNGDGSVSKHHSLILEIPYSVFFPRAANFATLLVVREN